MSLIDHDLQDENLKTPLSDFKLLKPQGNPVKHHCPICLIQLHEFPQEEGEIGKGLMTVAHRLECPMCQKTTRYYRDVMNAAAAVEEWE